MWSFSHFGRDSLFAVVESNFASDCPNRVLPSWSEMIIMLFGYGVVPLTPATCNSAVHRMLVNGSVLGSTSQVDCF